MKFDTSSGPAGNSALLESRILYPKREEQCLQFFYKMNGSPGDKLVIWIRTDDGTGSIRNVKKIHTITGDLKKKKIILPVYGQVLPTPTPHLLRRSPLIIHSTSSLALPHLVLSVLLTLLSIPCLCLPD